MNDFGVEIVVTAYLMGGVVVVTWMVLPFLLLSAIAKLRREVEELRKESLVETRRTNQLLEWIGERLTKEDRLAEPTLQREDDRVGE